MGSSLGPVLADIILTEFENIIVSDLINTGVIKFYHHYVDDTLVLIRPSDIPHVLAKFNSFDKNIKFTIDDFSDSDVKQLTQVNTHIFQVLNHSTAKPLGLILYSIVHLRSVPTKHYLTTKFVC
jgi:hypothetical protein